MELCGLWDFSKSSGITKLLVLFLYDYARDGEGTWRSKEVYSV